VSSTRSLSKSGRLGLCRDPVSGGDQRLWILIAGSSSGDA
jgi:hypothetical protein